MPTREHLGRLAEYWLDYPIILITSCTFDRHRGLAVEPLHAICREVWASSESLYGWLVGRYVLMPDHVHFFCAPRGDLCKLDKFVGKWKEWTAKFAHRRCNADVPFWQTEFFDHVLRSSESYEQKWDYVRNNPVRAGLVERPEDWPFQGEIHRLRRN